jgi:hypothetical protein
VQLKLTHLLFKRAVTNQQKLNMAQFCSIINKLKPDFKMLSLHQVIYDSKSLKKQLLADKLQLANSIMSIAQTAT